MYNRKTIDSQDAKESAEISWTDHFTEFYTTKKPLEINEIPKLLKSSLVKNREAQFLMEQYKVANNITEENGNESDLTILCLPFLA